MEPRKRQVFIVKDGSEAVVWRTKTADGIQCSRTILYDNTDEKFKAAILKSSEEGNHDHDILQTIQQAINSSKSCNFIEVVSTYNNKHGICKIWIRMTFDDYLLKILSKMLMEPKIIVQSSFLDGKVPFAAAIPLSKGKLIHNFESTVQSFSRDEYVAKYYLTNISYSVLLEWKAQETSRNSRCNVLEKLFIDKSFTDCCIRSADNTEIRCHRNILAANSDVFHAMLTSGWQESQTKIIEMTDVSDITLKQLLAYLYGREINPSKMDEELAFNMLCAAHKYNISSLEEDMLETLINKPDDSFNVDMALELYCFSVNVDQFSKLYEKTLNVLRRNPNSLISSPAYQDLWKTNSSEAARLLELASD